MKLEAPPKSLDAFRGSGGKGQGSHPETQAATWRYLEDVMLKEAERHKSQILSDSVQGEGPDW